MINYQSKTFGAATGQPDVMNINALMCWRWDWWKAQTIESNNINQPWWLKTLSFDNGMWGCEVGHTVCSISGWSYDNGPISSVKVGALVQFYLRGLGGCKRALKIQKKKPARAAGLTWHLKRSFLSLSFSFKKLYLSALSHSGSAEEMRKSAFAEYIFLSWGAGSLCDRNNIKGKAIFR